MNSLASAVLDLFRVALGAVVLGVVVVVSVRATQYFAGREGRRFNRKKLRIAGTNAAVASLFLFLRPYIEPLLLRIGGRLTEVFNIPDPSFAGLALVGLYATIPALLLLVLSIQAVGSLFWWIETRLSRWRRLQKPQIRSRGDLTPHLFRAGRALNRTLRFVGLVVTFTVALPLLLNLFPRTAATVARIREFWAEPLREVAQGVISYLPNLGYVTVILLLGWGCLKLIRYVFLSAADGSLVLPGFDPEWSMPTYKLLRTLWLLFLLMVIYPYLPGSDSKFFQGFSLFAGALVTFGSAGAIGNIVAGVLLTYTSAFRLGDVVRIGDSSGRVVGKTLLVTRLRTPRNEEITVPNANVLANTVTNFSVNAAKGGVALSVSAGIGYDVDRHRVAELMTESARKTSHIMKMPTPFVLQSEFGDYAANYELVAYTNRPDRLPMTYSELRGNILDAFNSAGVEIMTPSVLAHRDASSLAIPEQAFAGDFLRGIAVNVEDRTNGERSRAEREAAPTTSP